jgi:hypothetical protein
MATFASARIPARVSLPTRVAEGVEIPMSGRLSVGFGGVSSVDQISPNITLWTSITPILSHNKPVRETLDSE